MRYDLTDLQLFIAIAEAGNLTRGAARVHLAPSSASHRLKALEDALGVELFIRNARGVSLTAAGETLLADARRVFASLEQLHADMAPHAAGLRAQVTLFANTNAINTFLPADLGSFLRARPQLRIRLEEHPSPDIARAVASGEADIGVIAADAATAGIERLPYRRDRLVLVLPPGHPLANGGSRRFADAVREPFVSLHAGSAIHTFTMGVAADLGVTLDVRIQVRSFDAVLRLVAAGVGVGMVPAAALSGESPEVVVVDLEERWADRNLQLCVRAGAVLTPYAAALVAHLKSAAETGAERLAVAPDGVHSKSEP